MNLEPFGPFSPVFELNVREHAAAVAAAAVAGGVVVGLDEAVDGVSEVSVDGGEVVDWDAAL